MTEHETLTSNEKANTIPFRILILRCGEEALRRLYEKAIFSYSGSRRGESVGIW